MTTLAVKLNRHRLAQWMSAAAGRLWQPWCRRLRGSGAANPQPDSAQIKTLLDPPYPLNDLIQLHLVAGIRPITGSHFTLHVDHRRFQRGHAMLEILGLGVKFIAEIAQLIAQRLEVLQQQVDDFYAGWRQNARPDPAFPGRPDEPISAVDGTFATTMRVGGKKQDLTPALLLCR